jgi:trimethylamine--corrinoid protein Co-methyltransferase
MLSAPIKVLTADDMEQIHDAALTILQNVGMKIDSEKALDYLKNFGCTVDESSSIVKFPRKLVQRCVDRMKNDYDNADRIPQKMAVRYSHIRFRKEPVSIHPDFTVSSGGFCVYIFDLKGVRRKATMDDVHRSIHLVNRLDNIDYTGLPVSDQATSFDIRPVKMAGELAKYTAKFGGIETFKKEDIPYLIEIGTWQLVWLRLLALSYWPTLSMKTQL